MSDEAPRNENGQFASSEPLVGQAGVEHDAGFRPMPEPEEDRPEPESDIRTEAQRLAASRVPEDPVVPIEYQRRDTGEKAPTNETVPLERAAKDLSAYHGEQDEARARSVSADFAAEIDRMRAQALEANPEVAKELGLSKEEITAAEAAKADEAIEPQAQARPSETSVEPDPYEGIEGLEPETREALKKPQVRQFLESYAAENEGVKQAYSASLHQGQQLMQATVAALAPQLQGVPLEQWPQAVQMIAQVDPVRGKLIAETLNNWNTIQQAERQDQQRRASAYQQQFDTQKKIEDQRFAQMIGDPARIAEASKDVEPYFSEIGIDREAAARFFKNPEMHSAEVQRVIYDAIQYRKILNAPKAIATRELPPVQRPGTSVHRSSGDVSSKIQGLQKQLETATGHKAARISAELLAAKRSAANR